MLQSLACLKQGFREVCGPHRLKKIGNPLTTDAWQRKDRSVCSSTAATSSLAIGRRRSLKTWIWTQDIRRFGAVAQAPALEAGRALADLGESQVMLLFLIEDLQTQAESAGRLT